MSGLTFALPALAAAVAVGMIGVAALNGFARNPEKLSDIRSLMITAIVFVDSLAIIGIIVAIIARFI
ncbi:H(+)-transporting ATPase [Candidatus Saccharibacteria bacterium 32-49-12]|nr:MAG: H(+)-transporting ATPase [Candidatus Saccharibacteria bacterium 32-49-12]